MIPIESHENIHLYSKELDGYRNRILELIVQTYGKLRCIEVSVFSCNIVVIAVCTIVNATP
jgi:hypothetical protein